VNFSVLEHIIKDAPRIGYEQLTEIPPACGVYIAWLDDETQCFYIGRAENLRQRLRAHFSGQRGSDQFCLYVYDTYVFIERCHLNSRMTTKQVNKMTAEWVRKRVKFQWLEMDNLECIVAEKELRSKWQPLLNSL
jgi:hypothetical protein